METIEATYRIVTPMFIGDANQDPSDGIRPPSFKGALRFWWRALNWGTFYQESEGNEDHALKALHQKECELFGSAAKDGKGGQGVFLLSIQYGKLEQENKGKVHPEFKKYTATRYLGYGLMEAFSSKKSGKQAGQLVRGCLNEGQDFNVFLRFRGNVDDSVIGALKLMGLLGGMGSRARKGLGSIALQSLKVSDDGDIWEDIWNAPGAVEAYKEEILSLLHDPVAKASDLPPFSAVSVKSDTSILVSDSSPLKVLNTYGEAMMMYRSWGRDGKVLGRPREENFKGDHDWSKGLMAKDFHPQRVIFGLPHNYGKQDYLHVEPAKHKRRSSPLFFHVHPIGNQFVGVAILMPAQFLPAGEKVKAGREFVDTKIEWHVLSDFIQGQDKQGRLRFPNRQSVIGGVL